MAFVDISDPLDADAMTSACRLGFEHGVDIMKTDYTGSSESYRKVSDNCPSLTPVKPSLTQIKLYDTIYSQVYSRIYEALRPLNHSNFGLKYS